MQQGGCSLMGNHRREESPSTTGYGGG